VSCRLSSRVFTVREAAVLESRAARSSLIIRASEIA
jgi:hypothetical protein